MMDGKMQRCTDAWPKGTEIICPLCKARIATAKCAIYLNGYALSDEWEWHQPLQASKEKECAIDGVRYVRRSDGEPQIHTPIGWVCATAR